MQKNKKRFNPGEAVIPGITLAFGIGYFLQTMDASMVAIRWPYIIAALTGILWLMVVAFFSFDTRETGSKAHLDKGNIHKIALILCAPLFYIASMPYIGFALSSFVFLALLFRLLGGTSWIRNFAVSLVITGFLYVSMILLMKMSLPRLVIGSIQL